MKEVGKIFEVHHTEHISRIIGTNVRTMRGWHVDRSFAHPSRSAKERLCHLEVTVASISYVAQCIIKDFLCRFGGEPQS